MDLPTARRRDFRADAADGGGAATLLALLRAWSAALGGAHAISSRSGRLGRAEAGQARSSLVFGTGRQPRVVNCGSQAADQ